MKLYRAGFGEHWHYVGANSDIEAIVKVKTLDTCFTYLPVTATEIVEEFGNEIVVNVPATELPVPEFIPELREEATVEATEVVEEVKPITAKKKR